MSQLAPVFESVVGSTMKPGDRGTAKLVRDWGDRLVTVRYRYSNSPPTRFTTIELVVAQRHGPLRPREASSSRFGRGKEN